MTVIVGLTGSIGMGKTTAALMFRSLGLPICDSDDLVHNLIKKGGAAVSQIGEEFEGAVFDGEVNRAVLGKMVFENTAALTNLENILHPLVKASQQQFIKRCRLRRLPAVVLDVPLLFEVETDRICDFTIVVSAPEFIQRQRVMARPGMTPQRLDATIRRQMPDIEKRKKADFVVCTGLSKRHTFNQLYRIKKLIHM